MKNIQLNKFDVNQRRLLQLGVILILILFLGVYFFLQWKDKSLLGNNGVYLENTQLHVFNDTYTFNGYPDRILIHYPYLLYVQGNKPLTTIYNLETGKIEKEVNEILLDYYNGNIVYNKKETYFNDKNLGEYCDAAFIKSEQNVLCVTKQSRDFVDNMLIDIDPDKPNLWVRVYQSDNVLTTASVINGELYVGEINFKTKQNFITVNEQTIPVENTVNMIYEMDGKPYVASLKGTFNQNNSFYRIDSDKIEKVEDTKVILYK